MLEKHEIKQMLVKTLVEVFEIPAENITDDANLYEDLEIDSIDAIDLIDQIRRQTGFNVQGEDFKSLRTVADVVDTLYKKQSEAAE